MPNPTRISLPRVNYNFDAKACVPVLTVMLNKVEKRGEFTREQMHQQAQKIRNKPRKQKQREKTRENRR